MPSSTDIRWAAECAGPVQTGSWCGRATRWCHSSGSRTG